MTARERILASARKARRDDDAFGGGDGWRNRAFYGWSDESDAALSALVGEGVLETKAGKHLRQWRLAS